MSDVQVPAEGEIVLAWWGDEFWMARRLTSGFWEYCACGWDSTEDAPDGWVSLRHAKAAGRLAEAAKARIDALEALLACYRTQRRPSENAIDRVYQTTAALDAVLSEIGT